jgi:hypothetical protein
MANAINSGNPVSTTKFIVNKYDDIDGSRASQETPRGRLCFRDTNGRMTLPRTLTEARKAVYPVDWAKPLNPPPYFDGAGLNGSQLYPFNDGSLDLQETDFNIDPDTAFSIPWPAALKQYDLPPALYDLPVTSGNKVLVYDEGTFTYGSGNYTGVSSDYAIGTAVYASYVVGDEGKITPSGAAGGNNVVGTVANKDVFGQNTITVKLRGTAALS